MADGSLNARATIELAYLAEAPPHVVFEWLREQAPAPPAYFDETPEEILDALHQRREPMIDLGLAQWTASGSLLRTLFTEGSLAVRCAVLSNAALGRAFPSYAKEDLLGDEELRDLATEGDSRLLEALLSNPGIEDTAAGILRALFERSGAFADLDEGRWVEALLAAAENPLLHSECRGLLDSDPFGDAHRRWTACAAWRLLDELPATLKWAHVLAELLGRIIYGGCPREAPPTGVEGIANGDERAFFREMFEKWSTPEEDKNRSFDYFGELRCVIASKAPKGDEQLREFLRDNDDRFVRKGYYRVFQPGKVEEVEAAARKDGRHFVEGAIENDWFYRRSNVKVGRVLYHAVHDLRGTAWELLRPRYERRGRHLTERDPHLFSFDEADLSDYWPDQEEREEEPRNRPRDFARVGRLVAEVALTATRSEADARDSIRRLEESLAELEERLNQTSSMLVEVVRQRLDNQDAAARSSRRFIWWTAVIGFALVLWRLF